jgi:hypothetical protein
MHYDDSSSLCPVHFCHLEIEVRCDIRSPFQSAVRLVTTSAVLTDVALIDAGPASATLSDQLTTRHSVEHSHTAIFRYPCERVLYTHSGCSCLELRCEGEQCLHFGTDWPLGPVVPSRLRCNFRATAQYLTRVTSPLLHAG